MMATATTDGPRDGAVAHAAEPGGLKVGAIGFLSNVVIGVSSTAPAYSMAATLGLLVAVAGVGTHAPAVLLVSFVPMFCISLAYRALNRADPDCGTSFAWVTRALGPRLGWMTGFTIFIADVIVMATLSEIAGKYLFLLLGWQSAARSTLALVLAAVAFIAVMTWITYRGIELSARFQQALIAVELGILGLLVVVAMIKVYGGSAGRHAIHPSIGWVNPFALSFGALADGVLLGVFVYWGWDACVTVNEESRDSRRGPGRAAVVSTLILLITFVLVATAGQSVAGPGFLADHSTDVLSAIGDRVLGGTLDKLLILVVLTSTAACTQTSIMPTARTMLSMARWDAAPAAFGRIHPRFRTPGVATLVMGAVSTVWTVALLVANPAQSVLGDSITALGFDIAFYYGMTGLACAVYYRRWLGRGLSQLVTLGFVPLLGAVSLAAVFLKALGHYSKHTIDGVPVNYAAPLLGIEVPIVIGIGSLLLGLILALGLRPVYGAFFTRRLEVLDPSDMLGEETVA